MDAFHTLAADRLLTSGPVQTDFLPFTWSIGRGRGLIGDGRIGGLCSSLGCTIEVANNGAEAVRMDDYIAKPFAMEDITDVFRNWLPQKIPT
ncbi:MAG: hypothetical protein O3A95_05500 [Planctomycetota bacterium]|nr:hypothetical protein [Planctomycetota bacterium]